MESCYADYPVLKGLQRPLEFMGVRGRYIYWAGGTVGGAILGFIIGFVMVGFMVGLAICTVFICVGGVLIFVKQRKGLHSKREEAGVFVFAHWHKI